MNSRNLVDINHSYATMGTISFPSTALVEENSVVPGSIPVYKNIEYNVLKQKQREIISWYKWWLLGLAIPIVMFIIKGI